MASEHDVALADFGVRLLAASGRGDANALLSPASVGVCLAMAHVGQAGATAAQLHQALLPSAAPAQLPEVLGALSRQLNAAPEGITLRMANKVYVHDKLQLLQGAVDALRKHFDSDIEAVDFATKAAEITKHVNSWVETKTEKKIRELIPDGALDALTRMVLVNAVYFKGDWKHPFDPERTVQAPFHMAHDKQKTVPMMKKTSEFVYGEVDEMQILGLPYAQEDVEMFFFVPRTRFGLAAIEAKLTGKWLLSLLEQTGLKDCVVTMPRFRLEHSVALNDALRSLGVTDMFGPEADFSKFAAVKPGDLYVSAVLHKSFLDVDEKGAEAAAATAVMIQARCLIIPRPKPEITIDQPVLLALVHKRKDVLFLGRLVEP